MADVALEKTQFGEKKSLQFYLIFLAMCLTVFLSAMDFASVGTVLPTIIAALHGDDFVWVGSAYGLSATAFLPAFGSLSDIFGRRDLVIIVILIFAAGSAICGAANSMNLLIAGRTLQGVGGGGILAMTEIVVADIVPLVERGKYFGIIAAVWAIASVIGPMIGGGLATAHHWRWLFYINLPLSGVALVLVFFFLTLRTPRTSFRDKLRRMDWIGNFLVIASTTSVLLALAWGGVTEPWKSFRVLVPLILGISGWAAFLLYEFLFAGEDAIVPFRLLENRTSLSGHLTTLVHGICTTLVVYYLPVYFQAVHGASAVISGVDLLGTGLVIAPFAMMTGASVEITGKYAVQNVLAWVIIMIGSGVYSTVTASSSVAKAIGLQVVPAIGFGMLYAATSFAVLAPLPVEDNARALALFTFMRQFGQTIGLTIGTTILQNSLQTKLPADFLSQFPAGVEISYSIIPIIKTLGEPLRGQIKRAFAEAMDNLWRTNIGLGGLGLLLALLMRNIPLRTVTDQNWDLTAEEKFKRPAVDKESGDAGNVVVTDSQRTSATHLSPS